MSTAVALPKGKSIKDVINTPIYHEQFRKALPKFLTPDRFARVALTTLQKVPALERCEFKSLMGCFMDCASLGLEPDGRRAHIIPYGDKATLIIDYKGLIELAKRNGDVAKWNPVTVKERDKFSWTNGDINHEINWLEDRGALKAVYSHVRMKDGTDDYEVMTLAECEAIRQRSRAGNNGPWKTDYEAMCLKTVIRRHAKRLVLSPEFRDALAADDDTFEPIVKPAVVEQTTRLFAPAKEPEPEAESAVADLPDDGDEIPMGDAPAPTLAGKLNAFGGASKANLRLLGQACREVGVDMAELDQADPELLEMIAKKVLP